MNPAVAGAYLNAEYMDSFFNKRLVDTDIFERNNIRKQPKMRGSKTKQPTVKIR